MTNNTEVSLDNVIEALSRTKISKEESDEHGFVFKLSPNQLLALILDSIPAACEPATVQEGGPAAIVRVYNQGGTGEFCVAEGINGLPDGTKLFTHPPTTLTRERIVELIKQAQKEPDEELAADLIVAELSK